MIFQRIIKEKDGFQIGDFGVCFKPREGEPKE